jgi:hypothetical protein
VHPKIVQKNIYQKISSLLLIGGFPGFVWGWFQVPDANGFDSLGQLMQNYYIPLGGMVVMSVLLPMFLQLVRFPATIGIGFQIYLGLGSLRKTGFW